MSKYPLDQEALVEEYGDLLIKIALKAYMKEQAQLLEQEEAEAAPVPAPKGNVVAAAFRQVNLEDAKDTILWFFLSVCYNRNKYDFPLYRFKEVLLCRIMLYTLPSSFAVEYPRYTGIT